jgi:hypothetical protein
VSVVFEVFVSVAIIVGSLGVAANPGGGGGCCS